MINKSTDSIYGYSDSIKTIYTSDSQTIVLSKSFGLLRWDSINQIGNENQGLGFLRPPPITNSNIRVNDTFYVEGMYFGFFTPIIYKGLIRVTDKYYKNGDTVLLVIVKAISRQIRDDYKYPIRDTFELRLGYRDFYDPLERRVIKFCMNPTARYTGAYSQYYG